jgi:hypothetical protein
MACEPLIGMLDRAFAEIFCHRPSQCTSPILALFGHGPMSDLSPLSGEERKLDFGAVRSVDDPTETLAVRGGRVSDAGFSPYQFTRLSS